MSIFKNKKVLVNGCSFSRGPVAWPYALQKKYEFDLVNLAQAGAGNTYIHNSTISELAERNYDLVLIMWTGLDRTDLLVEDVRLFDQTPYTSNYQRTRNDWAEKIVEPINDQDYVNPNWVFGCGFINGDKNLINSGLFNGYYKYVGHRENISIFLTHLISTQSFLKQLNIPYVFMFYQDYINELIIDNKYKFIDQSYLLINDNISNIALRCNSYDSDDMHPGLMANEIWASNIESFLNERF